jgi:hypothetical protein
MKQGVNGKAGKPLLLSQGNKIQNSVLNAGIHNDCILGHVYHHHHHHHTKPISE